MLLSVVANPDTFNTFSGTPFTFQSSDLLSNDSGAAVMTSIGGPRSGTLATQSDGSFQYAPASNGTDSLDYTVQGNGAGGGLLLEIRTAKSDNFIPLNSMDWGVGNGTGGSTPMVGAFGMTAPAGRWSPGLFAAVGQATALGSAVITQRDPDGTLREMWTLSNAFVTSYTISTGSVGGNPLDSFSLAAARVDFSRLNYDSTGQVLAPTTAGWDSSSQTATQTASFAPSATPKGSPAVLRIGKDIAWPASSYSWSVDPSKQTLGSFSFVSPAGAESPALLSAVLNQTTIADLMFSAATSGGTLTWDLQNDRITSYSISCDGSGNASDSFALAPQSVSEKFTTTGGVTRTANLALPLTGGTSPPDFGRQMPPRGSTRWAEFLDSSGTSLGNVPLNDVAWSEQVDPSTGRASLADLSLSAPEGLYSPAIVSQLVSGKPIAKVVIQRVDSSSVVTQRWTLQNVSVTSDGTGGSANGAVESFTLAPTEIELSNITNGTTTTAGYDAGSGMVTAWSPLGGSDLSHVSDGTIIHLGSGADILANSLSWGASRSVDSAKVSFNRFTVAESTGAESAAVASASLRGTILPLVTITQRESGAVHVEWDLKNVRVVAYSASIEGDVPSDSFFLDAQAVTEIISGSSATWDQATNSGTSPPDFGHAILSPPPLLMLDLSDVDGNDLGQIPVASFQWGQAGTSQDQPIEVNFDSRMTAASIGVLASVFDGNSPASAVITQRNSAGLVIGQWSLNVPSFLAYGISVGGASARTESFSMLAASVSSSAQGWSNPPENSVQLQFPDGTLLSLNSLNWGAQRATQGSVTFADFSVSAPASALSPALAQDVSQRNVLDSLVIKRFDGSGNLAEEWDLRNVTFSSYSTSHASGGGTDSFLLQAVAVTETVYVPNVDGTLKSYSATWDLANGGTETPDFGGFIPTDGSVAIGTVTINVVPPAAISGLIFNDQNYNGVRNGVDAGLSGWTVYLDANNNGVLDPGEAHATTNANGSFTFAPLFAGAYTVREVVPSGWRLTTPTTPAITLNLVAGQNAVTPSIGYVQISTVTLDLSYLLTLVRHFGQQGTIASGDLNGDGTVNLADFLLLSQNFGHSLPAPATAAAMPPPTPIAARRRRA